MSGDNSIASRVVVVWDGGQNNEAELLASCYRAALAAAADEGLRTNAFPCISCGAFGYPHAEAVPIAVRTVAGALGDHADIERVTFVTNDQDLESRYRREIENLWTHL
jgi:O-acetyl-ADP-ribose deacetylase (regulator of RNase III)